MQLFNNLWARLNPKQKKLLALSGAIVLVVGVMSLTSGADSSSQTSNANKSSIRHVLTDSNTREVSMDALSAKQRTQERDLENLRREVSSLKSRDSGRMNPSSATDYELEKKFDEKLKVIQKKFDDELERIKKESQQDDGNSVVKRPGTPDEGQQADDYIESASTTKLANNQRVPRTAEEYFADAPLPSNKQIHQAPPTDPGVKPATAPTNKLTIRTFSQASNEGDAAGTDASEDNAVHIPAGSILTGVLLNGMDAPTGVNAQKHPFPSTLRIQHEAILPNRHRADIRECFLILAGYGDLSSERAYLRAETLSCITDDGGVIEESIDAYAVGEDGKAGIRGRLVSKQGQLIARSMVAGFMNAASKAFDVNPVPVVSTNPGDSAQYQYNFGSGALQGAAVKGAGEALDRVAKFYVEMAENIFPVIEIDAGRQVELIIKKGVKLTVK